MVGLIERVRREDRQKEKRVEMIFKVWKEIGLGLGWINLIL